MTIAVDLGRKATTNKQTNSMLISLSRVTSWFDTVYNIVTRWVNFRKKTSCMNITYNVPTTIFRSIIAQNEIISGKKSLYLHFLLVNISRSKCKIVNNTRNTLYLGQNTSKYRSQIIVAYVHANGFLKEQEKTTSSA